MATKGIDVSKHQGKIDWKKVSAGIEFCIVRAGYGKSASQKDERFEENYKGCKDNGIPCGVYWYSYATSVEQAKEEAKTCLSILAGRELQYPVYFDIEEKTTFAKGKETVSEIAKAFCDETEKAGYWAGIYMSASPAAEYLTDAVRNRYAMWIADYRYKDKAHYSGPHGVWQSSSTGRVNGISGDVDTDICYTDYPTAIAAKKSGTQQPQTATQTANTEKKVSSTAKTSATSVTPSSLKLGSRGLAVQELQLELSKKGYYYYDKIDGEYGKKTYGAVLAYQKDNGLTVDGIAGPATKKKLGL